MRLKTLEMSGFKSFVDRTVINFEDGITGVVGPNGTGKSNLVDAIRWVMGEMSAKHLRGSEMADIIFNGCETRQPTGMSQVFLTFDNTDGRAPAEYASYSEIQVGRRLYRSGESEYFINKTPCRLKDIVDLFLGTGVGTKAYSIVEQGMVGAIVSARPEERRMLIEEAAGISKFKARKEAALRKMESTRLNLARLSDIVAELTRQINSLNRQARKAERHQRISSELKERDLNLAATRHRTMRAELDGLSSEHARFKETEAASSAELAAFDAELEAGRLALAQAERLLDGVQQDLYRAQHSIKLYEAEIGHRAKEDEGITQQMEASSLELAELKGRLGDIDAGIGRANAAMVSADLVLAGSTEAVVALDSEVEDIKGNAGRLQSDCEEFRGQAASDAGAVANLTNATLHLDRRHVDVTGRIARDQAEIDALDRRRAEIGEGLSRHERDVNGLKEVVLQLSEEIGAKFSVFAERQSGLCLAEERLSLLRDEVSEKRSRISTLKELRKNLEGYRDGVRAVLTRTDADGEKLSGILGTVNEFVETEPEFEAALGAALGDKLQYVVVRSHEEGVEAIDYLKSAASGRSSFIPLSVRAAEAEGEVPFGEGVIGPLTAFVRFADDYRHICRHLLGDVVLVEDLGRALSLWEKGACKKTFVTRDGCVVDPSGVVTGGAGAGVEEQLVAQRRRIKELEDELKDLGGRLGIAEGEALALRDGVKTAEEQIEGTRRDSHEKELGLVGKESDLARLRDELGHCENERERLTVETAALAEEQKRIEHERAEAKMRIGQHTSDREKALADLARSQTELKLIAADLNQKERKLIDIKVEFAKAKERATSVEREIAGLVRAKTEALLGIGRREGELCAGEKRRSILAREVEGVRADLNLAVRSVGRLQESQRILKERYESGAESLRERELSIRDIRKRHDEALASFHEVELKLTEHRGRVQYLADGIRERYRLDLPSVEGDYAKEDLDLDAEEQAVAELRERLDRIGPVNIDAIQEFDELKMRHDFLSKQSADLTASLDNLSKAIARINRTSRQRFRSAFDAVDEKFEMLFPKLFQGGRAKLMLTDEENLLETGVEIVAQPPGKKLQSITLLSGGEKALTAVALVFSIFLVKPSPFCLLDEVDAPLDDANIDRFNDLIRSMTPHSQFILITHNKRTMELADLLYGVTMEEAGVSKMVSVRLGAEREAEAAA